MTDRQFYNNAIEVLIEEKSMKTQVMMTALALGLSLIAAPMSANAKKPHPAPAHTVTADSCACDAWAPTETGWEGLCSVQWTAVDVTGLKYGADIEFEAEWVDGETEMSADSDTDIEDYECTEVGEEPADEQCTAEDVVVVLPLYEPTADISFELRVKG